MSAWPSWNAGSVEIVDLLTGILDVVVIGSAGPASADALPLPSISGTPLAAPNCVAM